MRTSRMECASGSWCQEALSSARGCFISRRADLRAVKLQMGAEPLASLGHAWCCSGQRAWVLEHERSNRVVPLLCPTTGEGQECPPSRGEMIRPPLFPLALSTLWGSPLVSCGLIHLIYHGKLQGVRPHWFICLGSSRHSPGAV